MPPLFVLIHSPLVGPATWQPVADALARRGHPALVPSLLHVADAEPPAWRQVAAAVAAAVPGDRPVVLVAHSNAGAFVPVIRQALGQSVAGAVFVDALLPAPRAETPLAEGAFLDVLKSLVEPDGRLPRWSDWWPDEDLAPLFPDEETRRRVVAEQRRLPLSYFEQTVPVPDDWEVPCRYLLFAPPYETMAAQAKARGWPVDVLPGGHLNQLVDPEGVTEVLVNGWPGGPQPRRLGPARRGGRRMDPAGLAGGRRARPRG